MSILSFFVVIVMGAFASVVAVIAFVMDGYSNARVTPIKFQQKHGLTEGGRDRARQRSDLGPIIRHIWIKEIHTIQSRGRKSKYLLCAPIKATPNI